MQDRERDRERKKEIEGEAYLEEREGGRERGKPTCKRDRL